MALLEYHHIDKGNERTPNYEGKLKNFLAAKTLSLLFVHFQ